MRLRPAAETASSLQRSWGRIRFGRRDLSVAFQWGLLALLTLFPLLGIGYTTWDDSLFGIIGRTPLSNQWEYAFYAARDQGRFYFLVQYLLAMVPHWTDSWLYYKTLSLGPVLVNGAMLFFLLRVYSRSTSFAALGGLLFWTFLQNSWDWNLLSTAPFTHTVFISFLMLSLIYFHRYLRTSDPTSNWISGALYFMSLFSYEFMLLYLGIFALVAKAVKTEARPANQNLLRLLRPQLAAAGFYLLLYVGFRLFFPSQYSGNIITWDFSAGTYLKTLWQYIVSAVPGYYYFAYSIHLHLYSPLAEGHSYSLTSLAQAVRPEWIIKSALAAFIAWRVLRKAVPVFSSRTYRHALIFSGLLLVIPSCLLALVPRYQEFVEKGVVGYCTTYFSYFGVILALASTLMWIRQRLGSRVRLGRLFPVATAAVIAMLSYVTDYTNAHVNISQTQAQLRWSTLDAFSKTTAFASVPDGSIILAPSLWSKVFNLNLSGAYWTEYFRIRPWKNLIVVRSLQELETAQNKFQIPEDRLYFLKFDQELKDANQYVLFGRIHPRKIDAGKTILSIQKVTLFHYSKFRELTVFGNAPLISEAKGATPTRQMARKRRDDFLCANGHRIPLKDESGYFQYHWAVALSRPFRDHPLLHQFTLSVPESRLIDPESVSISYFPSPLDPQLEEGEGPCEAG